MPSSAYCSESRIKLRHVISLKIHISLHYSSFGPLYSSFYFQLVLTFKRILRKGINNSSLQCFRDPRKGINNASFRCFTNHVKASITPHLYDALQMEEVSIFANSFGPTIKFTCEMSSERAVFLDTEVFNRPRLSTLRILDSQIHFKPTGTFHYAHDPAIQYEKWFYQRRSITSFNNQLSQG